MLQGEHSAILLTFIELLFVIKIFDLSFFEWPFYTGFTVYLSGKPLTFVAKIGSLLKKQKRENVSCLSIICFKQRLNHWVGFP